jgi:hypothetical protein
LCLPGASASGPAPSRLEYASSNRSPSDPNELKFSFLKRPRLVGGIRTFNFHFAQWASNRKRTCQL